MRFHSDDRLSALDPITCYKFMVSRWDAKSGSKDFSATRQLSSGAYAKSLQELVAVFVRVPTHRPPHEPTLIITVPLWSRG